MKEITIFQLTAREEKLFNDFIDKITNIYTAKSDVQYIQNLLDESLSKHTNDVSQQIDAANKPVMLEKMLKNEHLRSYMENKIELEVLKTVITIFEKTLHARLKTLNDIINSEEKVIKVEKEEDE